MGKINFIRALLTLMLFVQCGYEATAQTQKFDIVSFTPPKGWIRKSLNGAVQFSKHDKANKTYCVITLFRAMTTTRDPKESFDMSWAALVKGMVTVTTEPVMQDPETDKGWEIQTGYAPYDVEGEKGVVFLVTSTGFERMVSLTIMTNSDIYQKNVTSFLESINLKPPTGTSNGAANESSQASNTSTSTPKQTVSIASAYQFNTTNFDDGWTSTIQEDWVKVDKNKMCVLIHYPNKIVDEYRSVVMDGLTKAWEVLVAPKYSSISNLQFKPLYGWETVEFVDADAVEGATGKQVYVVLFKKNYSGGAGTYLEFLCESRAAFQQQFGLMADNASSSSWDKLAAMSDYNKFAVAASDLVGNWTSSLSSHLQYVNALTGNDAGMSTQASNENFRIASNYTYNWDLGVASGMVGNIKFQSVKSSGKITMLNNWQATFSDIEGKPKVYNVRFSCMKGMRILWLDNTAFVKKD